MPYVRRVLPRGPWRHGRSANGFEYSSTHTRFKKAHEAAQRIRRRGLEAVVLKNKDKTYSVYVRGKHWRE